MPPLIRSFLLALLLLLAGCLDGPDQLTFEKLVERPEIWPLEMTLTAEHVADYRGDKETLAPGQTVGVSEVYPDVLVGWNAERERAFNIPPEKTDIVERAREIWRNGIPEHGRVSRDLGPHLVSVRPDGSLAPLPSGRLDGAEVIVFYYADTYNEACLTFAGPLNTRYATLRDKHPDFEMILVSRDPVEARFLRLMELAPPDFPVLAWDRRRKQPTALQHDAGRPPSFIAVDRHGRTLLASDPWNQPRKSPPAFFAALESLLEKPGEGEDGRE